MRYTRSENIFIGIIAALIVGSSAMLYADFNRRLEASDNPVIGVLKVKYNSAQRKYNKEVVWEELETETPVHNGDSIRTATLSDAVIKLNDETEIQLAENSMIVLNLSDRNAEINFLYGAINAKSEGSEKGNLNIKTETGSLNMEGGEVNVAAGKGSEVSIAVNSGSATLQTKSGTQNIQQNENALLTAQNVTVRKVAIRLTSPENNARLFPTRESINQDFSWSTDARTSILEVARDSGFANIIVSRTVTTPKASLNLSEGNYYWRVRARGKTASEDQTSETRRISVYPNLPIAAMTPAQNQNFSYQNEPVAVTFSFTKNSLANSYILQISEKADMSNPRTETLLTNFYTAKFSEGTYYWRVSAKVPEGAQNISTELRTFKVIKNTALQPPQLRSPNDRDEISRLAIEKSGVLFNWQGSREFANYELLIADDKQFSAIQYRTSAQGNFANVVQNLNPGNYFWKIAGIDANSKRVESAVRSFMIVDGNPLTVLSPADNANLASQQPIIFQWRESTPLPNLAIKLAKDINLTQDVQTIRVSGERHVIQELPGGDYYWMLTTTGEGSRITTEVRKFSIPETDDKIVLLSPAENSNIDMTNRAELIFEWRSMPSNGYLFTLSKLTNEQKTMILQRRVSGDRFDLRDLKILDVGEFEWSISPLKNPALQTSGKFKLKLSDPPTPPQIRLPETIYIE
ncbi:MAG: FecR domain-containing protein [Leptospiraceae bacterium]|nr:FecR domain-containing protein [Leptospiraceae bacterium]